MIYIKKEKNSNKFINISKITHDNYNRTEYNGVPGIMSGIGVGR